MTAFDDSDYLRLDFETPNRPNSGILRAETITSVAPLGPQLGVRDPKFVPDQIAKHLSGGRDVNTFAILDAAKLPGLAEQLEASGLLHRCLFKGKPAAELRDVAPWIVALDHQHPFTRALFTSGDAPWAHWDKAPGIFVRSDGSLDQVWQHFRRFTRVMDERKKWYYFRFWEPAPFAHYIATLSDDHERLMQWFMPRNGISISILAADPQQQTLTKFTYALERREQPHITPFIYDHREASAFRTFRVRCFVKRLDTALCEKNPVFAQVDSLERQQRLTSLTLRAQSLGLGIEKATADYCEAALNCSGQLEADPRVAHYLNSDLHPLDKARLILGTIHAQNS